MSWAIPDGQGELHLYGCSLLLAKCLQKAPPLKNKNYSWLGRALCFFPTFVRSTHFSLAWTRASRSCFRIRASAAAATCNNRAARSCAARSKRSCELRRRAASWKKASRGQARWEPFAKTVSFLVSKLCPPNIKLGITDRYCGRMG